MQRRQILFLKWKMAVEWKLMPRPRGTVMKIQHAQQPKWAINEGPVSTYLGNQPARLMRLQPQLTTFWILGFVDAIKVNSNNIFWAFRFQLWPGSAHLEMKKLLIASGLI